jgi:hypothetical protein
MVSQVQRVTPALRMTNYERSKEYYVGQLEFTVEWEHRFAPHMPVFMSVSRDEITDEQCPTFINSFSFNNGKLACDPSSQHHNTRNYYSPDC